MGRSNGLIKAGPPVELDVVGRCERQVNRDATRVQRRPVPGIGRVARVGVDRQKSSYAYNGRNASNSFRHSPIFTARAEAATRQPCASGWSIATGLV